MKRFLCKVVVIIVCLVVIDILIGLASRRMLANAKGGYFFRSNYICNEATEDIMIFGSSRAEYQYNPTIISDSLGMTCYNCGYSGNGIILNYGLYNIVRHRFTPKVVIYDIFPPYDLLDGNDNHKYLQLLKLYYNRPGIPEIFDSVDKTEKLKMLSRMYRYNSCFISVISNCLLHKQASYQNGFTPLKGEIDIKGIGEERIKPHPVQFDSLKLGYLNKFIEMSRDVKLVFVISPTPFGMDPANYSPVEKMCEENDILLVNFANDPKYNENFALFKDAGHLNSVGADEFTKDLMKILKKKL